MPGRTGSTGNIRSQVSRLMRQAFGSSRARVQLPDGLPGAEGIAKYILQEFQYSNGSYSGRISAGYARGFDR